MKKAQFLKSNTKDTSEKTKAREQLKKASHAVIDKYTNALVKGLRNSTSKENVQ